MPRLRALMIIDQVCWVQLRAAGSRPSSVGQPAIPGSRLCKLPDPSRHAVNRLVCQELRGQCARARLVGSNMRGMLQPYVLSRCRAKADSLQGRPAAAECAHIHEQTLGVCANEQIRAAIDCRQYEQDNAKHLTYCNIQLCCNSVCCNCSKGAALHAAAGQA